MPTEHRSFGTDESCLHESAMSAGLELIGFNRDSYDPPPRHEQISRVRKTVSSRAHHANTRTRCWQIVTKKTFTTATKAILQTSNLILLTENVNASSFRTRCLAAVPGLGTLFRPTLSQCLSGTFAQYSAASGACPVAFLAPF